MKIPRTKYYFRFLTRIDWNGNILKLNKFGPVLNQLAIEDAAKLDEAISFFYENQRWPKGENLRLFGRVDFIIWKRQAPYSLFCLRPVNLESVIKIWLDERQEDQFGRNEVLSFIPESRNQNMKKKKINHIRGLLVLGSLKNFRWSSEYGFKLRWHLALKTFAQIAGTMHTYRKRKEMLGRKINFRRKLKKKTFEEY